MTFGKFPFGAVPFADPLLPQFIGLLGTAEISTNFEIRIFAADHNVILSSSDTVWPNAQFVGDLQHAINNFRRSIIGGELIGEFTSGIGEMEISNVDGSYDYLPERYGIDGREIEIRLGEPGESWSEMLVLFRGTASDMHADDRILRIQLEDFGYRLSVPLQSHVYAGTGGREGTAELTGKRKPRAFGWVFEAAPPLVIPAQYIFQVNEGPVQEIYAVYDNGVPLTFYEDHGTLDSLIAVDCPAGKFCTCNAEGFFRVAFDVTPQGAVTCDVKGDRTGGTFAETAADIVHAILDLETNLEEDEIDEASFTALNTLQPAELGLWASHEDTSSVADAITRIMRSIGGWGGFDRAGLFEVKRFDAPSGAPVLIVDEKQIVRESMQRERLSPAVRPPPWRWRIGYQRVETVNTEPAGSVTATRRAYLAEQYRVAEASDEFILIDHPMAKDRPVIESLFKDLADAQDEADRLLSLYRGSPAFYRFSVGPIGYGVDIGDIVQVTYPRWDLTGGKSLRVVEVTDNSRTNTVEIVGFGSTVASQAAVTPPWTPLNFGSDLLIWLDATDSLYTDAGSTLATNGQDVQQWNDKSGNNDHVSNGAKPAAYSSTGLNGLPTLSFDATGSYVTGTDAVSLGGTVLSVYTVFSMSSSSSQYARVVTFLASGQTNDYDNVGSAVAVDRNASTQAIMAERNSTNLNSTNIVYDTPYRVGSIWDGVNHTIYLNGAVTGPTASSGTFGSSQTVRIGGRASVEYLAGNVSEVIIVKRALNADERAQMDSYLAAKWGF